MCTLGTEKLKSEQLAVVSARYGTPEVEAYRYATPVVSPMEPEVHHTCTILFAAEVRLRECAVKGIRF